MLERAHRFTGHWLSLDVHGFVWQPGLLRRTDEQVGKSGRHGNHVRVFISRQRKRLRQLPQPVELCQFDVRLHLANVRQQRLVPDINGRGYLRKLHLRERGNDELRQRLRELRQLQLVHQSVLVHCLERLHVVKLEQHLFVE